MHSFFIPLVSEFSFWLSLLQDFSALIGIVQCTPFRGVCPCATALRTALLFLPLREFQGWNGGPRLVLLPVFVFKLCSNLICHLHGNTVDFILSLLGIVFNCWHLLSVVTVCHL